MKIKIGDRVKLKGFAYCGLRIDGFKGILIEGAEGDEEGDFAVLLDGNIDEDDKIFVCPSQMVRLVRKKRREWWLAVDPDYMRTMAFQTEEQAQRYDSNPIHVREVKSGKSN